MNKITDKNFKQLYPKIQNALTEATFVAIDCEFSGLQSGPLMNESLFDSPKERYAKLKANIEPFVAIQFGLTAFKHEKNNNRYNTESFDFCLMPRSPPTKNRTFLVQANALEFLTSHNFDFNQFAYDAISYLNERDRVELSKILEEETSLQCFEDYIGPEDREEVESCVECAQEWLKGGSDKVLPMRASSLVISYLAQKQIRRCIKSVWTETSGTSEVTTIPSPSCSQFSVIRITADVRQALEENGNDDLDKQLLEYYTGFSRIFNLLTNLRKPIVGHNLLLDLMFMHKQFFRPLPDKYETFKSNIHRLFPLVYDTKFISYEMNKLTGRATATAAAAGVHWRLNALASLYSYCKEGRGRNTVMNSPDIAPAGEEKFHNAAWDSYCSGYCFVRMAHIRAVNKLGKIADLRELTNAEIMSSIGDWANRINVARADSSHMRLDAQDPASTRPRWLYVRASTSPTTCQIAQTFSRFGSIDVKRLSKNGFLVAVPNHGTARQIVEYYERNDAAEFEIVPYNPLRHSPRSVKVAVWVASLFVSGICAWILGRGGSR